MAANTLSGFGFRPANLYGSSPANYAIITRNIAYNYSGTIAYGDPVKLLTTGYIDLFAAGDTTIDGIFLGCEYVDTSAPYNFAFRPSWTAPSLASTIVVTAKVAVDPTMTFMVQANGTLLQTHIGSNMDITTSSSGAPNAAGISTATLLVSSANTTATLPFRVVGIVPAPGPLPSYDPAGANNFALVSLNASDLKNTTGLA